MKASLVVCIALMLAGSLNAATLTVDDDGPADFANIQSAVTAAVGGDTILIADGLYRGSDNRDIDLAGKAITLISVNGPEKCIIDCQAMGRGFYLYQSEGPATVIDGLTIMRGRDSYGGAIYCTSGASPTIRNCIIRDNYASYSGGGIACEYQTAPVIENCYIYSNRSDSQGGGISCSQSNAAIIGCTFIDNWTSSTGGALYGYYGDLQVVNCTFKRNTADYRAGALYCYRSSSRVINCVFTGNQASQYGGAVYLGSTGNPTFANCTFNANMTDYMGGAIYCSSSSTVATLTHCAFTNHSEYAIYSYWSEDSSIRSCLFYNNQPGDISDPRSGGGGRGGLVPANPVSELSEDNITGAPHFAFDSDVRLTAASACIDAGDLLVSGLLPETDLDGNIRPLDGNGDGVARVDIGAFEYNRDRPSIALSRESIELVQEVDGTVPEPTTLDILGSGGAGLDWEIDCNAPWLSVEPVAGSSAGDASTVTLTPDSAGLDPGIYQVYLTVRDAQSIEYARKVLVTLRIKGTLHVPSEYATIQAAIDAAMVGETVQVAAGTYQETLSVRQPVTLIGEGQPTLISPSSYAVSLTAGNSTIEGFDIEAGGIGIYVSSSNNVIAGNRIAGADIGLELASSTSDNVVTDNEISSCTNTGLYIYYSTGNTLRGNNLHDNLYNFHVYGNGAADYINDIDTSNTTNGAAIYYLVDQANVSIGSDTVAGCVIAINCSNITISNQTLSDNGHGVLFIGTRSSRVENCTISDNLEGGIVLDQSPSNTLTNNSVSNCAYGIRLDSSGGCLLRSNQMTDNTYNFGCIASSETDYMQDIASSNRVDGKPIYYLVDLSHVAIDHSSSAGCVYLVRCSDITLRDLVCEGNYAGVVLAYTTDSTIESVTVANNEVAGIYMTSSDDNQIIGCRTSDNGQGLYLPNCDGTVVDASYIMFNAQGLYAYGGDLQMTNCLVRGNSPSGGIYFDSGMDAQILNCTIVGNGGEQYSYPEPAGIFAGYSGSVTVANTILWANYPVQIDDSYDTVDVWHCDIQGGYEGEGTIDVDPMLTPDGHLRLGSPCILAGLALGGASVGRDIDDEIRSSRFGIDIGLDQYYDVDSDGLPNWWERGYFGDMAMTSPDGDDDGDGRLNITEYEVYGSDPSIPAATFYVDAGRPDDSGDGLSWETAKKTVQAAIDLSDHSDKVFVAPGLYEGNITPGGRLIEVAGLDPLDPQIVSATVISGGLMIGNAETAGCEVTGLTVTNRNGVGVMISGASPLIDHCSITNCYNSQYEEGGGAMLQNAAPTFVGCTISGNIVGYMGAGLYCSFSSPILRQCVLAGNVAQNGYGGDGSAIYAEDSHLVLESCTLAHNENPYQSTTSGSTIRCQGGDLTMTNSILWNRPTLEVRATDSTVNVTYTDIQGGSDAIQGLTGGIGNIAVDPCFVSPGTWTVSPYYSTAGRWLDGDYHLKSAGWRWTPFMTHGTHWVWDGPTSQCIDAGNPADALSDEIVAVANDPIGQWGRNVRINMGAYGGTREASMAPHQWARLTDINNDGVVNLGDFSYLGRSLNATSSRHPADATRDGQVDYADLMLMADEWLQPTTWCPLGGAP